MEVGLHLVTFKMRRLRTRFKKREKSLWFARFVLPLLPSPDRLALHASLIIRKREESERNFPLLLLSSTLPNLSLSPSRHSRTKSRWNLSYHVSVPSLKRTRYASRSPPNSSSSRIRSPLSRPSLDSQPPIQHSSPRLSLPRRPPSLKI